MSGSLAENSPLPHSGPGPSNAVMDSISVTRAGLELGTGTIDMVSGRDRIHGH